MLRKFKSTVPGESDIFTSHYLIRQYPVSLEKYTYRGDSRVPTKLIRYRFDANGDIDPEKTVVQDF